MYTFEDWDIYDADEKYEQTDLANNTLFTGMFITMVDSAEGAFNCHGYAWRGYEDLVNPTYYDVSSWKWTNSTYYAWINEGYEEVYWEDLSYKETDADHATHARYTYGDHSLLMTGVKDGNDYIVVSKWRYYPTYMHNIYDDPYGSPQGAKYFAEDPSLWKITSILDGFEFENNFNIEAGDSVIIEDNVTIYMDSGTKLNIYGTLILEDGATISGSPTFSGVDIESTGKLIVNGTGITIENASTGLTLYGDGLITNYNCRLSIEDCSLAGLYVSGCSADVDHVTAENCGDSSFRHAFNFNGYNAVIDVDFATAESSDGYGVRVDGFTHVNMSYLDIKNTNANHSIRSDQWGDVDIENSNIIRATGKYAVYLSATPDSTFDAQNNWWGINPPTTALFNRSGSVDYTNYKTSSVGSAGKIAIDLIVENKFKQAHDLSKNGDYSGAIDIYKEILANNQSGWEVRKAIVYLTRAFEKSDRDFDDVRNEIVTHIDKVNGANKAVLDFALNNLLVHEGKYEEAINAFKQSAEDYKGTSIEVEMIAKIAMIYGVQMRDKLNAKYYADQAAVLNPGQPILQGAYGSADIEYDPFIYTNKFEGANEIFDNPGEPKEKSDVEIATDVFSPSPNPFNPITTMSYTLANPEHVTLTVYNSMGQKVETLVDSDMSAGDHAVRFDGGNLASGMYFYRFEAGDVVKTGRMTLVK